MKKSWVSFLLLCLLSDCAIAQTGGYKFYSQLDSIKKSGFYNIEMTSELMAHLKTDYSDLRLVNDSGKWVPHVMHFPINEITNEIVDWDLKFSKTENSKINTTLLIENSKSLISNIGLIIRNTAAEKFCSLSGSDDQQNWFVINDSIVLNPIAANNEATNVCRINFPPSSYKYFKLVILNNNKDPFEIKGVVQSGSVALPTNYQNKIFQNPTPSILQKDSGRISYIKISQQEPYHFDNVSLKLSGAKYFFRKADVFIPVGDNHSFSNPGQLIQSFTISNNSTLQFKVPLSNSTVFYLIINNEDNLPLKVSEVNTTVNYRYVTVYLEKGNNYKLILGNELATLPKYDLASINTKISDSIPILLAGEITALKENVITEKPVKNNNWFLWAAIITALIILLLFTIKMVKEVDKRKQNDSL